MYPGIFEDGAKDVVLHVVEAELETADDMCFSFEHIGDVADARDLVGTVVGDAFDDTSNDIGVVRVDEKSLYLVRGERAQVGIRETRQIGLEFLLVLFQRGIVEVAAAVLSVSHEELVPHAVVEAAGAVSDAALENRRDISRDRARPRGPASGGERAKQSSQDESVHMLLLRAPAYT